MNASELKIGDLVKYKNGNILKIAGIEQASCSVWDTEENFVSYIFFDEIQSIPLTKEIVKKNGFVFHKDDVDHFCLLQAYNLCLDIDNNGYRFMKKNMKYVHELQHILWVLGIDDNVQINN